MRILLAEDEKSLNRIITKQLRLPATAWTAVLTAARHMI